ncbi:hypothetical protein chiPu_0022953, partial [Chiloscyllium punctatum]|nr:hypothetical protein [Chiloscyllium punctatum]
MKLLILMNVAFVQKWSRYVTIFATITLEDIGVTVIMDTVSRATRRHAK